MGNGRPSAVASLGIGSFEGVATSVAWRSPADAVLDRLERWWGQLPATRVKLKLSGPDGWTTTQPVGGGGPGDHGSIPAAGCGD